MVVDGRLLVTASYGIGWVDAIRGLMRRVMTTLCSLASIGIGVAALVAAWALLEGDGVVARDLVLQIVGMILFLTSTVVTWWFGSRGMRPGG